MKTDHSSNRCESDLKDNHDQDTEKKYDNTSEEDNGLAQGEPDTFSEDGYKID